MKARDAAELIALAALWGASFLFMRMGASEFGPVVLSAVRVAGATLLLLPLLAWRGEARALRTHWKALALVGLTNSALPFVCFSYAALSITAGLSSIFNATAPLFGALFAAAWLKDRLTPSRLLGLAIGFAGVMWLVWDKARARDGAAGAAAACLAGTVLYGFSATYAKKRLSGVPPMAVAAGSQLSASLVLLPPALVLWPATPPGSQAWAAAALLALLCTGVAYLLYFRLIANTGVTNAVSVTFLIPAFAVLWGALLLGEPVSATMLASCAVILLGTSLVAGLLKLPAFAPH